MQPRSQLSPSKPVRPLSYYFNSISKDKCNSTLFPYSHRITGLSISIQTCPDRLAALMTEFHQSFQLASLFLFLYGFTLVVCLLTTSQGHFEFYFTILEVHFQRY